MRALRVPRSGSTILSMFIALIATALLPVVFMAALVQSADPHPRPLRETLSQLAAPLERALGRIASLISGS